MKFLFRSNYGESLALAMRVSAEGNDVRLFIRDSRYQKVGDGLVVKSRDFPGSVGWADVVVYDGADKEAPAEAERLRRSGHKVVGGSAFADRLEHDRPFAVSLVEGAGILVPKHQAFKGRSAFQKARLFVSGQTEDCGWVWKPDGEPPDFFKTFVTHSREEIMRRLDELESAMADLSGKDAWNPDFLLEEKVEGIEVSTEAWFSDAGFSVPNGTLERKWLMNGDLGEQTGCMGNLVWRYTTFEESPLAVKLLKPLEKVLRGKYRGPIDVNAIVDEESGDPYFLEFTPRFGYSAVFAFSTLVDDFSRLLADTASGKLFDGPPGPSRFSCGVRATIPPYPYVAPHLAERRPVFGYDGTFENTNVHPYEVRVNDRGDVETSGPDGIVFEFTGLGSTIEAARASVYKEIEGIYVPDIRYRTDIGKQAASDYRALAELKLVPREEEETKGRLFYE